MSNKETVFEPASTPPNSPQDLNITMLIQAPERVSTSIYSAVPHISNQSNTNLLVPGHTQSYHDFYQYPWFRRLIVLIYGFTLALAGNVLWFFPFAGFSTDIQGGFVNLIRVYAPWLAYNFSIAWIFILVSLRLSYTHASGTASPSVRLELHDMPLIRSRWTSPVMCNVLTFVLIGSSVAVGFLSFWEWIQSIRSSDDTS